MSVQVKICGVTRVDDALAAVDAGADLIGLNFYPPSPRYAGLERAAAIARAVAGRAKLVGVFVSAARELVARLCGELKLDFLQLYSDEEVDAAFDLPVEVIRAFRLKPVRSRGEFAELCVRSKAEYILLDSYDPKLYGGAGQALALGDLQGID